MHESVAGVGCMKFPMNESAVHCDIGPCGFVCLTLLVRRTNDYLIHWQKNENFSASKKIKLSFMRM